MYRQYSSADLYPYAGCQLNPCQYDQSAARQSISDSQRINDTQSANTETWFDRFVSVSILKPATLHYNIRFHCHISARLLHAKVHQGDGLIEVVNLGAHLINTSRDAIRHGLKARLL